MTENGATATASHPLPDDTYLAYVVSHEAWYATEVGRADEPSIYVQASAGVNNGVTWEFEITEVHLTRDPGLKVGMFDDAFAAFAQIPWFFAALADQGYATLDGIRDLLDTHGAVDQTKRDRGY